MEYTGEFDFFYGKESERYHFITVKTVQSEKYRLEKHPNYKYTAEADKKNLRNPPYLLSYNDEEMESVRVKAPGEAGYILPAVVDSSRKRALEVEKKKKAKAQREMERLVPVEADLSKSKAQYEKDLADQQNKGCRLHMKIVV